MGKVMKPTKNPHAVTQQGKCVAEFQLEGDWLVMMPDGSVTRAQTAERAELACRRWFAKHVGALEIGVGLIEWRNNE